MSEQTTIANPAIKADPISLRPGLWNFMFKEENQDPYEFNARIDNYGVIRKDRVVRGYAFSFTHESHNCAMSYQLDGYTYCCGGSAEETLIGGILRGYNGDNPIKTGIFQGRWASE